MASAVETSLRMGSGANSTAVTRWAQAMSRYRLSGTGTQAELVSLWHATSIPIGSAFGQYGLQQSYSAVPGPALYGGGALDALTRQLEQKTPAGDSRWAEFLNPVAAPQ